LIEVYDSTTGETTNYSYDGDNLKPSDTRTWHGKTDAKGRPIEVYDSTTGEKTLYDYAGDSRKPVSTKTFDAENSLIRVETFSEYQGTRTHEIYDGEGNKTFRSESSTDERGQLRETKESTYGPDGKVLTRSIKDGEGRTVQFLDRQTGETTRYLYDGPNGELSGTQTLDSQNR